MHVLRSQGFQGKKRISVPVSSSPRRVPRRHYLDTRYLQPPIVVIRSVLSVDMLIRQTKDLSAQSIACNQKVDNEKRKGTKPSCAACRAADTLCPHPLQVVTYFRTQKVQLISCSSSIVHYQWYGKIRIHIFALFRNYFKSLNLEEEMHVYVFELRISVTSDTLHRLCKLIHQVVPSAVCALLRN